MCCQPSSSSLSSMLEIAGQLSSSPETRFYLTAGQAGTGQVKQSNICSNCEVKSVNKNLCRQTDRQGCPQKYCEKLRDLLDNQNFG